MSEYYIRPASIKDEKAVIEICHATFYWGNNFPDPLLVGLRWAAGYIRHSPEYCFIAEDSRNEPTGYLLCAPDTLKYQKYYNENIAGEIRERLSLLRQNQPLLYSRFSDSFAPRTPHYSRPALQNICTDYPAHLHINLLPKARGTGTGGALMTQLFSLLDKSGCPGLHLLTGRQNTRAAGFYRRMGFSLLHQFSKNSETVLVMGRKKPA